MGKSYFFFFIKMSKKREVVLEDQKEKQKLGLVHINLVIKYLYVIK